MRFWYYYKEDLEKFLEQPRSVFLGFFVPIIIAMAWLISIWCFTLLILPFLYSLYQAKFNRFEVGVEILDWNTDKEKIIKVQ